MTHALSLILWMATAQTADRPATAPITVIVQSIPSDTERALRAQLDEARARLDEARDQLAKMRAESGMADNAVAALLLSERPDLASLSRFGGRYVPNGVRVAEIDVYRSPRSGDTLVAVTVLVRNPRDQKTWEPTEAWVSAPSGAKSLHSWLRPVPVAMRSAPQRILPGQLARIAVVFDRADLGDFEGPFKVEIKRPDRSAFEFVLEPSDFRSTSVTGG